jgi:FkbM family methyltransferase
MTSETIFKDLVLSLPSMKNFHAKGTHEHSFLERLTRRDIESLFQGADHDVKQFKPFGGIVFPYFKMGAVDALDLFDLDAFIMFSFYWKNRGIYKNVVDGGANIGSQSLILEKCGFQVRAYEPDPHHFEILKKNLNLNSCTNITAYHSAISNTAGEMEFVRVLGNTTSSHLAGSKANPYGDLERFPVKVEAFQPIIDWADLIKLDVEAHEDRILLSTNRDDWSDTDAFVEIGNKENAKVIYEHFSSLGVQLFSQKINWQQVCNVDDMPKDYREGMLFITSKNEMPW